MKTQHMFLNFFGETYPPLTLALAVNKRFQINSIFEMVTIVLVMKPSKGKWIGRYPPTYLNSNFAPCPKQYPDSISNFGSWVFKK